MLTQQRILNIQTPGRGMVNITNHVAQFVSESQITTGLCHLFLHHTSASLIICENSDVLVQTDLEAFMKRLVPDGDSLYQHIEEGPDDMPSHVRTVLTQNSISFPITQKKLALGTWQGIYVWEHRLRAYERRVTITLQGE